MTLKYTIVNLIHIYSSYKTIVVSNVLIQCTIFVHRAARANQSPANSAQTEGAGPQAGRVSQPPAANPKRFQPGALTEGAESQAGPSGVSQPPTDTTIRKQRYVLKNFFYIQVQCTLDFHY